MDLAEYERCKFELAEVLRGAIEVRGPLDSSLDDPIRELFGRLAEDRFNLVVVGRFSRGKSSLMNAILGMDRLPTGIVPLTSVVTAVSYGSSACVSIIYEGRSWRTEAALEELSQYVTEDGNPGNVRGVKIAEIQLPAEILRRGFYFIDTPGLGSAIAENTQTTKDFLPSADAFLLVTGHDGALSEDELDFLKEVLPSARRIFVAVNKNDIVSDEEGVRSLRFVQERLADLFGDAPPQVFSTSATEGLRAKLAADPEALSNSGVQALEDALVTFMVREKSREFLLRTCDRVEGVLATVPDSPARAALERALTDVRLRSNAGETEGVAAIGGLAPARPELAVSCEICRAIEAASYEYLAQFQYQLTIDKACQHDLADRGGLCALHTWWYDRIASPQGICVGYPELLERWAADLVEMAEAQSGTIETLSEVIRSRGPAHVDCPVCAVATQAEGEVLSAVIGRIKATQGEAIDNLSTICLRHLPVLIGHLTDTGTARRLIKRQAGLFERIAEDMRRFAIKVDGRRRPLASDAERQASARGLRLLAGLPNLASAKRVD